MLYMRMDETQLFEMRSNFSNSLAEAASHSPRMTLLKSLCLLLDDARMWSLQTR